jgi:large subunit ribosomal protein L17
MRHRVSGRKLGRNASHRKAMFRNMACSLICSLRTDDDADNKPKVPGRIITTVPKAKELRPFVEKLITLAKNAAEITSAASQYGTSAERNSDEWNQWRESDDGRKWVTSTAPALTLKRRAFSVLRSNEAVDVLFTDLAERFADRPGGYTRIVRLAKPRLGDAGQRALIEFVGVRDRTRSRKRSAPAVVETAPVEPDSLAETTDES